MPFEELAMGEHVRVSTFEGNIVFHIGKAGPHSANRIEKIRTHEDGVGFRVIDEIFQFLTVEPRVEG
jgi:hypothetical protein